MPNKPEALFGTQYGSLFRNVDLLVGLTSNPAYHLLPNAELRLGIDKEKRGKIFRFINYFFVNFLILLNFIKITFKMLLNALR